MATNAQIIQGIQARGCYNALAGTEAHARNLLQQAMPGAAELPPAVMGQPYPKAPAGCLKWFQLHPPEPAVGHARPHFKYADWTGGKKGRGGSWGHIEF